jgi:hypothetical protein
MRIRRASVEPQLGTRAGGGEAARYMTTGAADLSRARWIVDENDNLILDPSGEPMVLQANGNVVLQSDSADIVREMRTTELPNAILVY